ncbi:MAG: hypothetical protein B7Z18_07800, partial [Alishewanella sp. 32-51-5]
QKAQKIGYVDLEYILENIPEYMEAQTTINAKAITWQNDIEKQQKEIEALKAELNNEKALLTKALIEEKDNLLVAKKALDAAPQCPHTAIVPADIQ